ncbi:similar to Saccharomyces cerevisiae YOR206W NOC2 Protein that forms a nucleolar complex with Mak21p that binds to 90S and 66S pre- ribosomes [Maudiozyma barnettii]|uniref:Similar to Saccharomyces cerevisiae YOR206W NOC2 Protein that forms a nucleolar complex with Mak21p that binds to 90S and 66S pre- ribosomes n=1 Tax=Maudiozyma barnettii TaxID=61262 RepID=A0A8H2VDV0_9SACH|nr:mRNA-binding ribosome synthesis protein NOC2 [Kazachstania barnettii]CAB4253645.1 similar to Saccharomyces cerevisiae YOR206W NOC2 Protein that forms a nucleolar complex with Mak21p that binds to 90S and 66S pre- ribosomes [Kazachstania barnettii]CAD1781324.1 similar to Saccharomyces cerevisiae YOR206W NOC2 Protein that forms a nucleolar complex with Mak21p that binds to 90S and 66S pre- ribosomes [Kazachstania barnettii]
MGKTSKATKKFQSKHLNHTLEHRKKEKLQKQKIKGRRGNKTEEEKIKGALTRDEQKLKQSAKEEVFKDMSVEEYFDKGIELPKENKKSKAARKAKSAGEDDGSSSEEEDMATSMATLSKNDPEFFKYLQNNDKGLLDFGASNPLDGISDDENDKEVEKTTGDQPLQKIELTLTLVRQWKKTLREKPTLKLLRNVSVAFKGAVNMNNDEHLEEYKYTISEEKAFQELMFVALKDLPTAVQKMVPYKIIKDSRTLPSNKNVSKISSIIKAHCASLLVLLNDITNTETAAMVLHSVNQFLPYIISYRRILKEIIKSVVEIWATSREVETQIASFAFLHNASKEFKKAMLETVLKSTYSTFVKNSRKTNIRTMPLINFQKNSAAELFAIDELLSYQVGFEFIRQLAIHLRNTMNATTKKTSKANPAEAYKIVYNWQFCHSLDFWSRVLSFSCNPEKEQGHISPLREMIFPLVQVTIGVTRLIPTAQFFPLRFYLVKSLIRLSQNTGVYIPIFPILSEILSSTAFTKVPKKKENLEAFDFDHNIKCTQAYLGTRVYQEGLASQFVDLLGEFFTLYCKSVSFPELVTPPIIVLRRYIKNSKNIKFNKQLSNIVDKLQQNSKFIEEKRSEIDFSPKNRSEANRFLNDIPWGKTPLGAYVVVQREVRDEKAKILRESVEEDDREKERAKKTEEEESEEEEDVEMSD